MKNTTQVKTYPYEVVKTAMNLNAAVEIAKVLNVRPRLVWRWKAKDKVPAKTLVWHGYYCPYMKRTLINIEKHMSPWSEDSNSNKITQDTFCADLDDLIANVNSQLNYLKEKSQPLRLQKYHLEQAKNTL
jgi:hypothetical protein